MQPHDLLHLLSPDGHIDCICNENKVVKHLQSSLLVSAQQVSLLHVEFVFFAPVIRPSITMICISSWHVSQNIANPLLGGTGV